MKKYFNVENIFQQEKSEIIFSVEKYAAIQRK